MSRESNNDVPDVGQKQFAQAVGAFGVPSFGQDRFGGAVVLGASLDVVARKTGYATLVEVIETSIKHERDIKESYDTVHNGQELTVECDPVEIAKSRALFLRLRLDAAKTLIESDPKGTAAESGDAKVKKPGIPKPREVVGIVSTH